MIGAEGANRQEIFHDDEDCKLFLDVVEKYKRKTEISVYAWCLMSNRNKTPKTQHHL